MVEKIICRFVDGLSKYNNYNNDQIEQVNYVLKVLAYEIIKFSLIIFIFSIVGYFKESMLIISIMSVTKPFIGGYHEDSQIKCFVATVIIIILIIILGKNNSLSFVSCIIVNLISLFSIYNKAPIIDSRMPITKEEIIKKNRKIGITNVVVLVLFSIIIFKAKWASQIIVWTILVQAILMFNKYKNKKVK